MKSGLIHAAQHTVAQRRCSPFAGGLLLILFIPLVATATAEPLNTHDSFRIEHEICVFDVWSYFKKAGIEDTAERADVLYLLTSLQGIVNREAPRLYLLTALALFDVETRHYHDPDYRQRPVTELDAFWFEQFKRWGYLERAKIRRIDSLEVLLKNYRAEIEGLVRWEMGVPATVNAALMAAGCDNLLPVSKDLGGGRLHGWLRDRFPDLTVRLDLANRFDGVRPISVIGRQIPSTGSAKNDVYRFVIERYQKPGQLDPAYMWYNCDAAMWGPLRNHYAVEAFGHLGDRNELQQNGMYNADYWVAKRAFFIDLLPWADDRPNDDPHQPLGADLATWHAVLQESYRQRNGAFGVCGGFVPWWIKYTDKVGDKHEAVATEWEFIALITSYNMVNDADAAFGIANASFFMHLPHLTKAECRQPPPPPVTYDPNATYLSFFMLDYDGSAWLNQMITSIYADPQRGEIPLNWAINPLLQHRVPHAFRYLHEQRTENDIFGIANNGAGYLSPLHLVERNGHVSTDGLAAYEAYARSLYDRYGVDYTAFYITPRIDPKWTTLAARLSPAGFGYTAGSQMLVDQTPVTPLNTYHVGNVEALRRDIARVFESSMLSGRDGAAFRAYRCILIPPTMIVEAVKDQQRAHPSAPVRVIDAPNFFRLLKHKLQQPVNQAYRHATHVSAIPRRWRGLQLVACADGDYRTLGTDIEVHWELPAATNTYLYVDVDDIFAETLADQSVRIEVEWLDSGSGTLALQYNSVNTSGVHAGAYEQAAPTIERQGTAQWRRSIWELSDAAFRNAQNGGADFRLHSSGESFKLRRVTLKRAGS